VEIRTQDDAAVHAGGEALRAPVSEVGHLQHLQDGVHPSFQLRAIQGVEATVEAKVFARGETSVEAGILNQKADAGTHPGALPAHVEPIHTGSAGRGLQHGGQQPQQRGFARAIGTQQAKDFTVMTGEGDRVHRHQFVEALGEGLNFNHEGNYRGYAGGRKSPADEMGKAISATSGSVRSHHRVSRLTGQVFHVKHRRDGAAGPG